MELESWIRREQQLANDLPVTEAAVAYGVLSRLTKHLDKIGREHDGTPVYTTVADAARALGISAQAVRDRCRRGMYRYEIHGKKWLLVNFFAKDTTCTEVCYDSIQRG